jgi:HSP20 family molecular chaperone IbpA
MDNITLAPGQQIEITVDGRNLIVRAEKDADGDTFVSLGSNDSDLEGQMPGEYYLVPRV